MQGKHLAHAQQSMVNRVGSNDHRCGDDYQQPADALVHAECLTEKRHTQYHRTHRLQCTEDGRGGGADAVCKYFFIKF